MFFAKQFIRASEPLADTVVLELVDDGIDGQEGHVDDVHPHIEIRRLGINTSIPKRLKPTQSQLPFLIEATGAPIFESGQALGHTPFHCADVFHLTLCVEGLDAVKHYARSTTHGQVVRIRHDEQQVDASACCSTMSRVSWSLAPARPSVYSS